MVRKPSPEKRSRFLHSALKLVVANGVHNTSTAEIARHAGTAAGTLFLYFPTKQDLINELVLLIGQDQSEYIKSILTPTLSVLETFSTIWHGSIRWFQENKDAYQYIQQVRDSGLVTEDVVSESNQYFDYYYYAIKKGLVEGVIKTYPVELIGEMLYRDIVAMMNLINMHPDHVKHEEYFQLGFTIFWDGIKTTES